MRAAILGLGLALGIVLPRADAIAQDTGPRPFQAVLSAACCAISAITSVDTGTVMLTGTFSSPAGARQVTGTFSSPAGARQVTGTFSNPAGSRQVTGTFANPAGAFQFRVSDPARIGSLKVGQLLWLNDQGQVSLDGRTFGPLASCCTITALDPRGLMVTGTFALTGTFSATAPIRPAAGTAVARTIRVKLTDRAQFATLKLGQPLWVNDRNQVSLDGTSWCCQLASPSEGGPTSAPGAGGHR